MKLEKVITQLFGICTITLFPQSRSQEDGMTGYIVEDQVAPPEDEYSLRRLFGITDPRLAKVTVNKDAIREMFETLNYAAQGNPSFSPSNPEIINLIAQVIYNLAPKGKNAYKEVVQRIPLPDTPSEGSLQSYLRGLSEGQGVPQMPPQNAPPVMNPQYRRNSLDTAMPRGEKISGPGQGWPDQLPYEVLDSYSPPPAIQSYAPFPSMQSYAPQSRPIGRQGPPVFSNAFPQSQQSFGAPQMGPNGFSRDPLQGLMSLFGNNLGAPQTSPDGSPVNGASFNPLQSLASVSSSGLSPAQPSPDGSLPIINPQDYSLNPLPELISLVSSFLGSSKDDKSPSEGFSLFQVITSLFNYIATLFGAPQESSEGGDGEEGAGGASLNPMKNLASLFGSAMLPPSTPGPYKNSPTNNYTNPLASLLGKVLGAPQQPSSNPAQRVPPVQQTPVASAFNNPALFGPNRNPGPQSSAFDNPALYGANRDPRLLSSANQNLPTINVNDIAGVLSKLAQDPSINPPDPDQPTEAQRKVLNLIVDFFVRHRYKNITDDKIAKVHETVKEFTSNLTKDITRLFGTNVDKLSDSQQIEEMVEGVMQIYPGITEENAREFIWVLRDNGLRLKQNLDGFLDLVDPKTRHEEYTPRPDTAKLGQRTITERKVVEGKGKARPRVIVNKGGDQTRRRLVHI